MLFLGSDIFHRGYFVLMDINVIKLFFKLLVYINCEFNRVIWRLIYIRMLFVSLFTQNSTKL